MADPRRSVLAVAVLSMLTEAPMHAYRMQQLIKERHKDDVINVSQRASLYQTIQRLERDGLLEVESTERAENRPERTTYRVTVQGRSWLETWLKDMLATPAAEFPQFPAALSFLPNLTEAEVLAALGARADRLRERLAGVRSELSTYGGVFPRVFLVESEYLERVLAAELSYVEEVVAAVTDGAISWTTTLQGGASS